MSDEKKKKKTLLESFEGLTDPRNPEDILHKLIDIVTITIQAITCGANSWNDVVLFACIGSKYLSGFPSYRNSFILNCLIKHRNGERTIPCLTLGND